MTFAAGDVVILKSGGQPMTVIAVDAEEVVCIWTGEEGDLFRETIPAIALLSAEMLEDDDDAEDEDEEDAEDDDADKAAGKKKASAA